MNLARITVQEVHGIRRFLYPLHALVAIPAASLQTGVQLQLPDGRAIPAQATAAGQGVTRIDFALSLDPHQKMELLLDRGSSDARLEDPLRLSSGEQFCSEQKRFVLGFSPAALPLQAVYDGRPHLRAPLELCCNGQPALAAGSPIFNPGPLASRLEAPARYPDGRTASSFLEITACKSWVALTHTLSESRAGDEITASLPFALSVPSATCDFGVGGGIYGRLHEELCPEIIWDTEFLPDGTAAWRLDMAGRNDYRGVERSRAEYHARSWFHLIDCDKALAVAVTRVPAPCRHMTVTLHSSGDLLITFRLDGDRIGPAIFGVCYHFLNDIPAVSAATNPQSILLPPVVNADPAAPHSDHALR